MSPEQRIHKIVEINTSNVPVAEKMRQLQEFVKQEKAEEEQQKQSQSVQKVELMGAEVVTIKGEKGETGDEPADERLIALIKPLIPKPIVGPEGKASTVPGPQGKPGPAGKDGKSIVGPAGKDGRDGVDGKDAEQIEIQSVIKEVLKSLQREKLHIKNIDGVDKFQEQVVHHAVTQARGLLYAGLFDNKIKAGSNITVTTAADGSVTISSSGGGGGSGGLLVETPSGTQNGSNKTFTVLNTPLWITVNGKELYEEAGYTRSTLTLTLDDAPFSGDVIRSFYSGGSSGTQLETPTGTQDGVNKTFTVANTPVWFTVQGQALFENAGYTRSGLTLTLDNAPFPNDILRSHY